MTHLLLLLSALVVLGELVVVKLGKLVRHDLTQSGRQRAKVDLGVVKHLSKERREVRDER